MANRVVSVQLKAMVGGYVADMAKAAIATKGVGESSDLSGKKAKVGFDLAGKASMLMGGAVAGALAGIMVKSTQFESAMSAVGAATQATAGTLGDLRDAAMKAGADTQYSATEAANGITEMAKAGVSAKDIMGGGLTGALSLAAAGQLDVADAAGIASTAMTQFSLSGEDLPHVADLLAAGAGKAMGSVQDLGAALNQSGLIASAAGLNIEETTAGLAAFASAGLIGSDAGTSFKTMLQAIQAPSGKAAELMDSLGINMYDAQGNMLGLSDMAGQLQGHLGGLTDEQRNAALATIFGSDAVRAANVLYKEGASGIEEWTKKVDDSGFAADQAAALNDNLAGDLERLGGSFDTLLITLGSGTQGPLRELVQMLGGVLNAATGLIGVLDGIPGPVIAGTAAFAALLLLRGPLSTMFTSLAVSITSTVTGLGMATGATSLFGIAAAGARTAVAGLVSAAAPLATAIAAAYAVKGIVDFVHAGDDATSTVKELDSALKAADGNGARFDTAKSGLDDLKKKAADAQAVIDKIDSKNFVDKVVLSPFNGDTKDLRDAQKALEAYQAQIEKVEGAQTRYGQNIDVLAGHYHIARQDVIDFADAHGIDLSGSLQIAQTDFMRLAGASIASGDAMINGKTTAEDYQAGLEGVSQGASDAKTQIDLLKTSLDVLTGANITTFQAEQAVAEAMRAATGALEGLSGKTLTSAGDFDAQSEAGSKAADTAFAYIDAANQQIATMESQGATSDVVLAKDAQLRDGFIKTLGTMGITGQAAQNLADKYYGIPSERTTKITADTKQATDAAAALQQQIDNMRGREIVLTTYINEITRRSTMQDLNGAVSGSGRPGAAIGGIAVKAYASGGVYNPMPGGVASIVAPNTWRVIGDRVTDDEAYIPINSSARSQEILGQTAERMGYGLSREVAAPAFASREFSGSSGAGSASTVVPNVTMENRFFIGDREITDIVRVESRQVVDGRLEDLHRELVRR